MHAKIMQNKGIAYDIIASSMNTSVPILQSTYLNADDDYNVIEMNNKISMQSRMHQSMHYSDQSLDID